MNQTRELSRGVWRRNSRWVVVKAWKTNNTPSKRRIQLWKWRQRWVQRRSRDWKLFCKNDNWSGNSPVFAHAWSKSGCQLLRNYKTLHQLLSSRPYQEKLPEQNGGMDWLRSEVQRRPWIPRWDVRKLNQDSEAQQSAKKERKPNRITPQKPQSWDWKQKNYREKKVKIHKEQRKKRLFQLNFSQAIPKQTKNKIKSRDSTKI